MMINKLSKGAIVGLFFMQLLIGSSYADGVKKSITLAIFPCTDVAVSFKKFQPLVKYLKEETGFDIRLVVPRDSAEFERAIKKGDIAFSVYLKAVDAGVVCDHFLEEHSKKQQELGVEAEEINVICRTKSIPTRVFAARQEINNDIIAKVNQALLRLDNNKPDHKKILYRAELGGFLKSKDEDYDGIRMLIGAKR